MARAMREKSWKHLPSVERQVALSALARDRGPAESARKFGVRADEWPRQWRARETGQRGSGRTAKRARVVAAWLIVVCGRVCAVECEQLPLPSVTVNRLDEPVVLNTTYSYKSLTILGASLARPDNRVLGLTRGTARITFSIKTPSVIDQTGRWECASPQLVVSYGFSPMTVYVAKEFPKGSCAYNEIYQHELRHVKAYQEHLVSIRSGLVDAMTRRFATGSPWRGAVGQARKVFEDELNDQWMPYIRREIERVESAQALIDTAEEYARVAQTCNGDIKRLGR